MVFILSNNQWGMLKEYHAIKKTADHIDYIVSELEKLEKELGL